MILIVVALVIIGALAAACAWLYNRVSQVERRLDVGLGLSCDYKNDVARLDSQLDAVEEQVANLIELAMAPSAAPPEAELEHSPLRLFCDAMGVCAVPPRQRDGGELEELPPDEPDAAAEATRTEPAATGTATAEVAVDA